MFAICEKQTRIYQRNWILTILGYELNMSTVKSNSIHVHSVVYISFYLERGVAIKASPTKMYLSSGICILTT